MEAGTPQNPIYSTSHVVTLSWSPVRDSGTQFGNLVLEPQVVLGAALEAVGAQMGQRSVGAGHADRRQLSINNPQECEVLVY